MLYMLFTYNRRRSQSAQMQQPEGGMGAAGAGADSTVVLTGTEVQHGKMKVCREQWWWLHDSLDRFRVKDGARERVQRVEARCWWHEFDRQNPCLKKKSGVGACICNPRPPTVRGRGRRVRGERRSAQKLFSTLHTCTMACVELYSNTCTHVHPHTVIIILTQFLYLAPRLVALTHFELVM